MKERTSIFLTLVYLSSQKKIDSLVLKLSILLRRYSSILTPLLQRILYLTYADERRRRKSFKVERKREICERCKYENDREVRVDVSLFRSATKLFLFFFISTTQLCYYKYYSSTSFDSTFIVNII